MALRRPPRLRSNAACERRRARARGSRTPPTALGTASAARADAASARRTTARPTAQSWSSQCRRTSPGVIGVAARARNALNRAPVPAAFARPLPSCQVRPCGVSAAERRIASSTAMSATPSAKVAGAGPAAARVPSMRARKCSARRVYGAEVEAVADHLLVGRGEHAARRRRPAARCAGRRGLATSARAVARRRPTRRRRARRSTPSPAVPIDARLDEDRAAVGRRCSA